MHGYSVPGLILEICMDSVAEAILDRCRINYKEEVTNREVLLYGAASLILTTLTLSQFFIAQLETSL